MRRIINIEKHLKGMTVLRFDTSNKMGEVSDVIVHPVKGKFMGLIVRTDQRQEHALATRDFFIGKDAVTVRAEARFIEEESGNTLKGGIPALGEFVGTNVVTNDGKLLGRVSEVYISLDMSLSVYRVTESTLQKFWGGGFYIAGDLPSAYSQDGVRLIVPSDTEARHAVKTVNEALINTRQDVQQKVAG
jgi:sporulation protein YlmC with PRC-barrel domain